MNVEFKILNGTIELVGENNRKLNEILVSTYPVSELFYYNNLFYDVVNVINV